MTDPTRFPTTLEPGQRPGLVPVDLLPDAKLALATLALDAAWLAVDGFDWRKLATGLLVLFGGWLVPSWNPPRSTIQRVVSDLRPGDAAGPVVDDSGRRAFIVAGPASGTGRRSRP